jgi:hypothetical protein
MSTCSTAWLFFMECLLPLSVVLLNFGNLFVELFSPQERYKKISKAFRILLSPDKCAF